MSGEAKIADHLWKRANITQSIYVTLKTILMATQPLVQSINFTMMIKGCEKSFALI